MVNILRQCAETRCQDPRDHIYGILGMTSTQVYTSKARHSPKGLSLTVDYRRSTSQVFQDLAIYLMRCERCLSVLHLKAKFRHASIYHQFVHSDLVLPSWTPDWRYTTKPADWINQRIFENYLSPLHDIGPQELPNILRLNGYCLATVSTAGSVEIALEKSLKEGSISPQGSDKYWRYISLTYGRSCKIIALSMILSPTTAAFTTEESSLLGKINAGQLSLWEVPGVVQNGDVVVAVMGGYTPLLIRPIPAKDTYEYVGPALLGELNRVCPSDEPVMGSQINVILAKELVARQQAGDLQHFDLE